MPFQVKLQEFVISSCRLQHLHAFVRRLQSMLPSRREWPRQAAVGCLV